MNCPFCGHEEIRVVDSRTAEGGNTTRRRRECLECKERFTTFERVEQSPLTVLKRNGRREPFNGTKILDGLLRATVKRDVSREKLEKLVADLETELRNEFKDDIPSKELGDRVLKALKEIDKVAYIRFASVYKDFKDLDEFTDELKELK